MRDVGVQAAGIVDDLSWLKTVVHELNLSDVLLNGVLCFMLYAGSAGVTLKSLKRDKWTILTLAIGSTVIACLVTGALLHYALGWMGVTLALSYAFVFGALISPTDPIATLAILKAAGLAKRLEAIINGESLFNDGVGVVLFTVFLAYAQGSGQEGSPLVLFLREVLGGMRCARPSRPSGMGSTSF
jgi:CPA1 family monovalent cation:H+ antiporter